MYLIIGLFAESRLLGKPIEMQSRPPRGNECQQESTPGGLGERPITRGLQETFLLETFVTFDKLTLILKNPKGRCFSSSRISLESRMTRTFPENVLPCLYQINMPFQNGNSFMLNLSALFLYFVL